MDLGKWCSNERADLGALGITPFLVFKGHVPEGKIFASLIELYGPSESRSHPGEEFVFVLSGKLNITVGAKTFNLEAGESIDFWSSEEHVYAPEDGSTLPTRLLCIRAPG